MKIERADSDNYSVLLSDDELDLLQQIILMGKDMLHKEDYELEELIKNNTDEKAKELYYELSHIIVSQLTAADTMAATISQTRGNKGFLIRQHKIEDLNCR